LFGQQPAGGGANPIAGIAFVADRRGLIDKLDIILGPRVAALRAVDDE
jgi:hypothetical protein